MTRPCECGLDSRPRRLFGFPLEPVDGAPCFFSGSIAPGGCGLPSTDSLAGFVSAGQHITAMGSDAEHKNEIAPAILKLADLYVADSAKQTRRFGELHHAIDAGLISVDAEVVELGQIIAGKTHGRRSASDITMADLTGTGVQDTAIATLASDRAKAAGAGTTFES